MSTSPLVVRLVLVVSLYVSGSQAVCWANIDEMISTGHFTQRTMSSIMRDFFANRTLHDMCVEQKAVDIWQYSYSFSKFRGDYHFSHLFLRPDKTIIWSIVGNMWPDATERFINWQGVAEIPNRERLRENSGRIYILYTDDDAKIVCYYSCWDGPEHNVEAVYITQVHGAYSNPNSLMVARQTVQRILDTSGHSNVVLHCYPSNTKNLIF